ncbi:MAG: hypothetical protein FJ109_19115, partial [Deltaproteobacteria bacterium]|nr:hypothetical protein [Deltaproteobacteria bacterium]
PAGELPGLPDLPSVEETAWDFGPDDLAPACEPGTGCFGDKCIENAQCQSGWCVEHMGEGVSSQLGEEECPAGWTCRQIGSGPDTTFACVSNHANLCKPCATTEGCKAPGGAEDVCISYGQEGSFCGGACKAHDDCPWGFSCVESITVEGLETKQCVADAGVCPCTGKSVELGLATPCSVDNDFGTCAGKRQCVPEGLTACDAAIPAQEACNGVDDDCDLDVDEPGELEGNPVPLCDDGNECTKDSCKGEAGCTFEPLDQGECKDGDACTVGDHCVAGQCIGNPVVCDDGNPCTDDSCNGVGGCVFTNNQTLCDDDDPCTVGDVCVSGSCGGTPVSCDCQEKKDCLALEDGNLCNGTLVCDKAGFPYKCAVDPSTVITCPPVPDGPDELCLKSSCLAATGKCTTEPDHEGFACDDGDPCTIGEACAQGNCEGGVEPNCSDDNPCTDDLCVPGKGCLNVPNANPCNDANACTTQDVCSGGACAGGPALVCDDGNVCSGKESCDPAKGCVPGQPLACGDGNLCNGQEICDPKLGCVAGPPLVCDDGNPCTGKESCDPAKGCVPGQPLVCNDGKPCTADSCDPAKGCLFLPQEGACDDGNACTVDDHCEKGACVYTSTLTCADDNPCTDNLCDPKGGCVTKLNTAPCDDGNLCTTGDHCQLGGCISGGSLTCNDNNPCTDDSCDPKVGCQHKANSAACDDGNPCTTGDYCTNGWCTFTGFTVCDDGKVCNGKETCDPKKGCVSGTPPALDDGIACTFDFCDEAAGGVVHSPQNGACDDQKFCNGTETCDAKKGCLPGIAPVLDDKVPCTQDLCDEVGDKVVHVPDHAKCSDGTVCTGMELCDVLLDCVPGIPLNCNDGVECTLDSCDKVAGCQNVPDASKCNDSNACTNDSCDIKSGCLYVPVANGTPCTVGGLPGKCQGGVCAADCQPGTQTFNHTGAPTTYALPSCASKVTIEAWGASGGDEEVGVGGKGAYMKGDFTGLSGKTLEVRVGGQGAKGTCSICGGGGGGGSFAWVQGSNDPLILA